MKAILNFFNKLFGKTDTETQEVTTKTEDVAPIVEETKIPEMDMTFVSPSISVTLEDNTVVAKLEETAKKPTRKKPAKPAVKKMKKAPVKAKPKTNKKK